ncbi:MAG TPA: hypothetical protein DD477_12860 [Spirochaetaceae bacterium]|nr:hypothetical protein [Spirochaetaceae bacterium]
MDAFLPVLWQQLAFRYRDWPPELLFEIFNEPMDIADATWASLQARVLAIIRADNPTRTVIVTGAQWGGIDGLLQVQPLPDRHLLYSFHFYEPFLFTHQGADWSNLADFYGLPFPAGKALPWPGPADDERAAWWDYYFEVDQVQLVRERIASVADWAERHGVRLFCGEMGAYNQRMAPADRQAWYALAVAELRASNIPFTSWDYRDAFGVFRPDSAARFPQDLDTGILAALGLRQPPPALATAPEGAPVEAPLAIYDEGPARGIQHDSWDPLAQVRWLDTRQPASGRFCLSFGRLERYDVVGFTFRSSLDLSSLAAQGAVLRLNLQWPADAPDLELRWVQNPANGTAKPWRKSIRLGPPIVAASRAWQTIRIALADFVETGAWDGEWHEPAGLFDWSKVGRLEFVSEYSHLGDHEYRIDDLRLELP